MYEWSCSGCQWGVQGAHAWMCRPSLCIGRAVPCRRSLPIAQPRAPGLAPQAPSPLSPPGAGPSSGPLDDAGGGGARRRVGRRRRRVCGLRHRIGQARLHLCAGRAVGLRQVGVRSRQAGVRAWQLPGCWGRPAPWRHACSSSPHTQQPSHAGPQAHLERVHAAQRYGTRHGTPQHTSGTAATKKRTGSHLERVDAAQQLLPLLVQRGQLVLQVGGVLALREGCGNGPRRP